MDESCSKSWIAVGRLPRHLWSCRFVWLSLAAGLAVNGAVFGILRAVVLQPLAYPQPESLVEVSSTSPEAPAQAQLVAPRDFLDWQAEEDGFEGLAGLMRMAVVLTGSGEPESLEAVATTTSFFDVLGMPLELGRPFLPEEGRLGHNNVAVLSHRFWQRRFGGENGVLGRQMVLDGESYTIIGVARPEHEVPSKWIDVYLPLAFDPDTVGRRRPILSVVGRLAMGTRLDAAQATMAALARRHETAYPDTNAGRGVIVRPLKASLLGDVPGRLVALQLSMICLLLVVCLNVAALTMARMIEKGPEMALRRALGASSTRLVASLVADVLVAALAGAVLAIPLAFLALKALVALSPAQIHRLDRAQVDLSTIAAIFLLAAVSLLVCGILPALRATIRNSPASMLRGASSGSVVHASHRGRHGVIVLEIALALCLLSSAGSLLQSFDTLRRVPLGFEPDRLLVAHVQLPLARYPGPSQQAKFFELWSEAIRELPGVRRVAYGVGLPLQVRAADFDLDLMRLDGERMEGRDRSRASARIVSPAYFRALGVPLVAGREFSEEDSAERPLVVMINKTLARRFFPGEDPIGESLRVFFRGEMDCLIVGVVGDTRSEGPGRDLKPEFFWSFGQLPMSGASVLVEAEREPLALASGVRATLRNIDPDQPILGLAAMQAFVVDATAPQRFQTMVSVSAALATLLLAAFGVFGLLSQLVLERREEIGIRRALGATNPNIWQVFLVQAASLTGLGVLLGLALLWAWNRWLGSAFFGLAMPDPLTLVAAAFVLSLGAMVGSIQPCVRATALDPAVLLKAH